MFSSAVALTFKTTVILTAAAVDPIGVITMVPEYVPAVRPAGLTETVTFGDGLVVVVVGETLSHDPPTGVNTDGVAVKVRGLAVLETVMD